MDALRNVSTQSLIVPKPGGGNMHLLPGRAVTLSAEDLQSPQAQQLVRSGLAVVEKLGKPAEPRRTERRRGTEPAPPKPLGPQ